MKQKYVVAGVLAVALTAGAGIVHAKSGHHRGERPTFEMLDTNKDGQITLEEMQARSDARLAKIDADGDGQITKSEAETAFAERAQKRVTKMFERMDENGDGVIEKAEAKPRRDPAKMFNRIDSDDNGSISAEEFAAARDKMKKRHNH